MERVCNAIEAGHTGLQALVEMDACDSLTPRALLLLLGRSPEAEEARPAVLGHLLRLFRVCSTNMQEARVLNNFTRAENSSCLETMAWTFKRARRCNEGKRCPSAGVAACALCSVRDVFERAPKANILRELLLKKLEDKESKVISAPPPQVEVAAPSVAAGRGRGRGRGRGGAGGAGSRTR